MGSTRHGVAVTILAIAIGLAGCVSPFTRRHTPDATPGGAPLRVGTSGDYAPFSSRTADGGWTGFDIEVARGYAADRGRRLVLVPFRWPELATRFGAGDFDLVMSGVTVTPERLVAGTMTAAVARSDAVLVVAAAPPHDAATHVAKARAPRAPAFDRADRTVAVNRGGHLEQVARARLPHARIVAVDDNTALPGLLASGAADAIVTDTLELGAFEAAGGSFRVVARLSRDVKAYWLPPTSGLAADFDAWLREREQSGWLPALRARYFGATATDEPHGLTPAHASIAERVRRRMALMPLVAAAKRAGGLPIEDRAREARVVDAAAGRGAAVGLDATSFVAFVGTEISVAKAIQNAVTGVTAQPPGDPPTTPTTSAPAIGLDDLRRAIDRLDGRIVFELASAAPLDTDARALADAIFDDGIPGFTRAHATKLARALAAVRVAPAALSTARLDARDTASTVSAGP